MRAVETNFAVDSTGFYHLSVRTLVRREVRASDGAPDWMKVHVMCGVTTNMVTRLRSPGAYATIRHVSAPLLDATAKHFRMDEVTADKAYLSRDNLDHVANVAAMPYIPFKSNSVREREPNVTVGRAVSLLNGNRELFLEHYHRRSMAETTFMMIKAKFGEAIRSKTEMAQVNELLCKVLCHNICCVIQSMYELGVVPDFGGDLIA